MIITWQILDTRSKINSGLITEVTYSCMAQLENDMNKIIGTLTLTGDSTAPNFIPINLLTEDLIIEWVKSTLGGIKVDSIETSIQDVLLERKYKRDNAVEKSGLPWRQ